MESKEVLAEVLAAVDSGEHTATTSEALIWAVIAATCVADLREQYRGLVRRSVEYYGVPGNECGGLLHVCLDDGNIEDGSWQFCLGECLAAGDEVGAQLARDWLKLMPVERDMVYADFSSARDHMLNLEWGREHATRGPGESRWQFYR